MSFQIANLLQSVRQRGEQFNETDLDTKKALLDSAKELVAALEPPTETVLRILTGTVCSKAQVPRATLTRIIAYTHGKYKHCHRFWLLPCYSQRRRDGQINKPAGGKDRGRGFILR
jgi:hypothetical protein